MFVCDGADLLHMLDRSNLRVGGFDADKRLQRAGLRKKCIERSDIDTTFGIYVQGSVPKAGLTGGAHGFVGGRRVENVVLVFLRVFRGQTFYRQRIAGAAGRCKEDIAGIGMDKIRNGTSCAFYELFDRRACRMGGRRVSV